MTRRDKKILWVGGVLLLAFIGYRVTFAVLSIDATPPDEADLLPHREPLPDAENAFGLFEQAHVRFENDLTREQGDALSEMVDDGPYDAAEAEAILQAGAEALALWQEGLERPGIAVPPITSISTLMHYPFEWMSLAELADLRALHLHRQGEQAEAMETALGIVRFGRMAIPGNGNAITYLVGATIEERGLARIRRIAREANLHEGTVRRALGGVTPELPLADKCRREVRIAAARLVLALKAYERATGRLPDHLDALVPDYLDAVPRDGFDGKPFRYDRARQIIYSVGANLTDDGADALPQDESAGEPDGPYPREREDLVFRLPGE